MGITLSQLYCHRERGFLSFLLFFCLLEVAVAATTKNLSAGSTELLFDSERGWLHRSMQTVAGAETHMSVLLPCLGLLGRSSGTLTASDREEAAEGEKEGAVWVRMTIGGLGILKWNKCKRTCIIGRGRASPRP